MIQGILKKIFGSRNDRLLRQYMRQVGAVNALEPQMQKLSDAELRAKTDELRSRVRERLATLPPAPKDATDKIAAAKAPGAAERREALEEALPEAFAVVREAAR